MIWVALSALAVLCLAPLALALLRPAPSRGRRGPAMALHRAQLAELDRDLAEGRIGRDEHASAVLEVQRRLLAAADNTDIAPKAASRFPLVAALTLVPALGFALYLTGGSPDLPAAPHAKVAAELQAQAAQEDALISQLRARLKLIDPRNMQARQGYVLLGNAEAGRGRPRDAAQAWKTALALGFDPTLAAQTAEAMTQADGKVGAEAAALFRQALQAAPADAPWRGIAEQRLREAP